MKKGLLFCVWLLLIAACTRQPGGQEGSGTYLEDADHVQVVLFHLAQRCESCTAVEEETKQLLQNEFQEEVASGKIRFVSLNFQSKNGRRAAELLQATGQTLYVVRGDSIDNLTSPAFMFASTHPESYREALRKALNIALE